ncbi:hypothetical protein [Halomicronema sp. CCY15110]|uniref:hypothetical protein n=1 Tax=Halomicronema sp. CCY15110 TaxID=2767773 RepID=UPI00195106E2|nr:hypothetical protein [Halomicronema sp. CCY15110]
MTELLFREMNGFDEVERSADPAAPAGAWRRLGYGACSRWEVTIENVKRLGQEMQDRRLGKPISFTVKAGDR